MTPMQAAKEWEAAADRRLRAVAYNAAIMADRDLCAMYAKGDWTALPTDPLFTRVLETRCRVERYLQRMGE